MGVLRHADTKQTVISADSQDRAPMPKAPRRKSYVWRVFWVLLLMGGAALAAAMVIESRSSRLQALEFSRFAANLSYSMQAGPRRSVRQTSGLFVAG
jgi:hypothetical protein